MSQTGGKGARGKALGGLRGEGATDLLGSILNIGTSVGGGEGRKSVC